MRQAVKQAMKQAIYGWIIGLALLPGVSMADQAQEGAAPKGDTSLYDVMQRGKLQSIGRRSCIGRICLKGDSSQRGFLACCLLLPAFACAPPCKPTTAAAPRHS